MAAHCLPSHNLPMSKSAKTAVLVTLFVAATAACAADDEPAPGASSTTGGSTTTSPTTATTMTSTGSGGSGAVGGSGGSGGSGGDPWLGGAPTLTIADCVDEGGATIPNMGNEGHLAAVRLTPPSYPFEVTGVAYVIAHADGGKCNGKVAHRLELYVETAAAPSNMPTIAAQIDVPASSAEPGNFRLIEQQLAAPITLNQGESLFVAVELAGTPAEHICIMNCEGTGDDDRNYWSNATAAPYNWATLASFGNATNLRIGASGSAK